MHIYTFRCEMVCHIMIPIYNPTWKRPGTEMQLWDYSASSSSSSESAGAHSIQRPVPFPLATRSTILGCEHVTACVAEILFIIVSYKRRAMRNRTKECNLTLPYPIILPADRPCVQRYRGNDPGYLSTGHNPIRKFKYYPARSAKRETYREVRVDVRIL